MAAAIDNILFDVDGTLIDAREDIANAVNHALKKRGLKEKSFDEIVSYIGTGVKDLLEKSLGAEDDVLVEKAVADFTAYYKAHPADKAVLYPHVVETLEHFNSKKKFIVTNRYTELAEAALVKLGIRKYFLDITGGDDENCLKPLACALDNVFSKAKADKSRSIIVGDMSIDVMAGKNAGIKTCWVSYGLGKAEDIRRFKPDYMIDDIAELKGIII